VILETPIGSLVFACSFGDSAPAQIQDVAYEVFPIRVNLPEGMEVERVTAVLVKIFPELDWKDVRVGFRWREPFGILGSPSSGECLDAQYWEGNGFIVMVGTEDFDALSRRLPRLALVEWECPVIYHPNGIEVHLPLVPAGTITSLHFVVAVNPIPEPAECSAWFAVDVRHEVLLAASYRRES